MCLRCFALTCKLRWDFAFYNAYPLETGAVLSEISFQFVRYTSLPQRPEGAQTLTGKHICNFRPWTCYLPVIHRWVPPNPRQLFHECPLKQTSSDDKSSTGLKFVIRRLLRWNFWPMAVYPPIAPSTVRWFHLPTGHAPATLPCDTVEPPTTRQIGDSSTFNRIFIGVWSVGYRKHRTLISGSSADDRSGSGQNLHERGGSDQMSAVTPVIILPPTYQWRISLFSHGQVSCVSCYLSAIVRHYSDELRWSPDENVLPVSHQCLATIGLPTGHTPASNVPALYLRNKLKCVRPISDEIGRKWKIHFPTSFRSAAGLCGRGALSQSSGGTSCDLTKLKWNWNMSRSDWKCSPVHRYWLNQSKWTRVCTEQFRNSFFPQTIPEWNFLPDSCVNFGKVDTVAAFKEQLRHTP